MKQLAPLPLKESYYIDIEKEINRLFYEVIYKPLIAAIGVPSKEVTNSTDPLSTAIASGRIYFEDGQFKGRFSSKTSKELRKIGATFNPKSKTWSYKGTLPPSVSTATVKATMKYEAQKAQIITALDRINSDKINEISNIPDIYQDALDRMEGDFQKTVKSIAVVPTLSEAQRGIIGAEWGQNLDLYVKGWIDENVIDLREKVQENVFAGRRSSAMIEGIQKNYGVSRNKAKFLAKQETGLLMAKFRETRYKDIGSSKYRWSGAMDKRERHDHKILQNKVFSWDNPPVVDQRTGRRAHPTEDFGCRCVAIAIIE